MKKILITTTLIILVMNVRSVAQTTVNLITGLQHAQITNTIISDGLLDIAPVSSWNLGVGVDRVIDNHLDIRTGVFYKRKGFEIGESTTVNVLGIDLPVGFRVINTINYLEVPLQLKFNTNRDAINFYVTAGPSVAYAMNANISTRATAILDFALTDSDLSLGSEDYNRTDILLNGAAGVNIPYGQGSFMAEVGYSHGLNSFTSDNFIVNTGMKHRSWNFNIGYGLRF